MPKKEQPKIEVVSYVRRKETGELVKVADLTPEEKRTVATKLSCALLNEFFAGIATFTPRAEEKYAADSC